MWSRPLRPTSCSPPSGAGSGTPSQCPVISNYLCVIGNCPRSSVVPLAPGETQPVRSSAVSRQNRVNGALRAGNQRLPLPELLALLLLLLPLLPLGLAGLLPLPFGLAR